MRRLPGKNAAIAEAHRGVSVKLKEAIEELGLQRPPLPIAAIQGQALRLAKEFGEEPPRYSVVYRIIGGLPDDLVTLAHQGTKAYCEEFELVLRREADEPNAIWQSDDTPLDILLLRPDGKVGKSWLTVAIDDYSRAVAGYLRAMLRERTKAAQG